MGKVWKEGDTDFAADWEIVNYSASDSEMDSVFEPIEEEVKELPDETQQLLQRKSQPSAEAGEVEALSGNEIQREALLKSKQSNPVLTSLPVAIWPPNPAEPKYVPSRPRGNEESALDGSSSVLEVEKQLAEINQKIDKMIGHADAWQQAAAPRIPYLSLNDISMLHQVTAKIHLGTPAKLHLMCESITGSHFVKDQPGLDLCLQLENVEWLRSIYQVSSRMLCYLARAGLLVTLGLGQTVPGLIPELSSIEAALPLLVCTVALETVKTSYNIISFEWDKRVSVDEAWSHLRTSIAPYEKELFKLHKVKYLNLKEGKYAWVCDTCMTLGIRDGSLECL